MAINFEDGERLLQLSTEKGLYIGNATDTFLGGGIQKSIELLKSGVVGDIKIGNAIFAFPGAFVSPGFTCAGLDCLLVRWVVLLFFLCTCFVFGHCHLW